MAGVAKEENNFKFNFVLAMSISVVLCIFNHESNDTIVSRYKFMIGFIDKKLKNTLYGRAQLYYTYFIRHALT